MTQLTADEIRGLALRMMRAAELQDFEEARSCYTPNATLWFNFSGATVTIDAHLQNSRVMRERVLSLHYEDIRVTPFENGYVQQHVAHVQLTDGRTVAIPGCFVVQLRDGLIAHRDEYVDPSPMTKAA